MPPGREWLDWTHPLLPAAAAWLVSKARAGGSRVCDLRDVLCVVSGRRAGRVLLAKLVGECDRLGLRLAPPVVVTPGPMLDRLLPCGDEPVATALESHLAWIAAFKAVDGQTLHCLAPARPDDGDLSAWSALAHIAGRLHEELAGQRLTFDAVAERAERKEMLGEGSRWRAMHAAFGEYQAALRRAGLADGQVSRGLRLQARAACASPVRMVALIGIPDLNAMQRLALGQISQRVVALVHAPAEHAERFDDLGCVIAEAWREQPPPIDDANIIVAEGPADQAQEALRLLSRLGGGGRLAPSQITIGLGDAGLAPTILCHAEWAGVAVRAAAANALGQSPPYRALQAIATWLADQRFATFAALLRHPDVEDWVIRRCAAPGASERDGEGEAGSPQRAVQSWLTLLDESFSEHLHGRLDAEWLGDGPLRGAMRDSMRRVWRAVGELLAPLADGPVGVAEVEAIPGQVASRTLGQWALGIAAVLAELYDPARTHVPNTAAGAQEAWQALREALGELAESAVMLHPRVDAATALRFVLAMTADQALGGAIEALHVEMLGWLELHADLAPALVITGFNEGRIPDTVTADAFLPDSLRRDLGLMCNSRREARDMYLLHAILCSRPHVWVIVGRTDADGDPITPSRLLLRGDDATLVRRVSAMSRPRAELEARPPLGLKTPEAGRASSFVIPVLGTIEIPDSMRVTDFRRYLACPYRYALERLCRLRSCSDDAVEMDAMQFGGLAHQVLEAFALDPQARALIDHGRIAAFLEAELDRLAPRQFGRKQIPAVQVQLAQLKARLHSFAHWQAQHAAEGWRIEHVEVDLGNVAIDFPDGSQPPMPVSAKIDRIDRHRETGQWMIADYKTSDRAKSPHRTHNGCEKLGDGADLEWIDLQLPLYRHLAAKAGLGMDGAEHDTVRLGYIALPRQTDGATFHQAAWTAAHLAGALQTARDVITGIRAGQFDMNRDFDTRFDAFGRICHSMVFRDEDDQEGLAGDATLEAAGHE